MKQFIIFILLIILLKTSYSQNVVIKGRTFDFNTGQSMSYTNVFVDSMSCVSNDSGFFILKVTRLRYNDTLKVRYIGCFDLNFINLPTNVDTINLDKVPIFDYFAGYDMTDFFCGRFDFKCKRERKKHIEAEKNRILKYYSDQNNEIRKYQFKFNDKYFKINVNNNCIDLK